MFKKAPALPPDRDFTLNLRETSFYRYGHLRTLGLTGEVTAIAVDPVLSLFGVGTSSGQVHVYGQAAFQFTLPVEVGKACAPIRFLLFHPGHHRLVVIDESNTLHTFSLSHISDHANPLTHPPLPVKEGSYTLWGTITAVELPLPSYTHLFLTMKDGTTLSWDLSRRMLGNWKIGNCWLEHEQRMIRSGVPGKRSNAQQPMATCIAMNPRDLNIILIGYEGGVVAWNVQKAAVDKTFEMTLPPGAPGGGTYLDQDSLWTERSPTVTTIAWRPDGLTFAVGHSDGCMTFWAYADADKPLMVRTITHEDVNVTDADELFSAGALDTQIRSKRDPSGGVSAVAANREPIFKLAWASFPDQPSLKALIAAQGTEAAGEPLSNATVDYAERGETLLLVLGGQSPGEKPGINILQFPAYVPPVPQPKPKGMMTHSEGLSVQDRYAYRDSLAPTGTSNFVTRTPPEDFVLLPRSSPYFALSHDPIALIISLTPDPNLSRIDGPSAQRGTECYRFPPPRSVVVPPSPGRKNYIQPGEGERVVPMTPAPRSNSRSSSPVASPGLGGWKLPWTSSAPSSPKIASPRPLPAAELARTTSSQSARSIPPRGSPMLRVPTPDSVRSMGSSPGFGPRRVKERKRYRNPSSLWSGSMSVLGCELYSLPTPLFKRFIAWSIETLGEEPSPRVPLRGGMAVPDLQSHGAPEVKVAKMENYRIMATWHPDASVRFWDISPHLLLLPTPLRFEYPGPLPHLTISLGSLLEQDELRHLPLAKLWRSDRSRVKIASVHLAREALECTITLQTGEVIVTKFQEAKGEGDDGDEEDQGYFPKVSLPSSQEEEGWVEEVTEVGHLAKTSTDRFRPVAIITLKRGEVTRCAISDIGFIAMAFASNSLAIVDMRGPDVILREGFDSEGVTMKKKQKKGNVQNVPGEASPVGSMKWVVAGLGADSTPRPRLIVSYVKGMTKIYTPVNVLGEWLVESKPPTFTNDSLANPVASFVIHPDSGNELVPSAEALSSAMQPSSPEHKGKDVPPHCLWIAVSRKSIRVAVNFNGDKVGKVEMEEELSEAFYITRHGKKVLVVITNRGTALFYSLPFLEFVIRLDLFFGHNPRPIGRISMDDRSGDFIEHSSPLDINLRTLFHFRKPFPPRIDPCAVKHAVPAQPQPLSASYLGWIWGAGPLTGAQLDTIVAGPARPPPPPPPPAPRKPLISWGDPPPPKQAPKPEATPTTPLTTIPKRTAVTKTKNPIYDAREREDAYSEMRRAAEERGNFLDNLGDSINNVHVSAGNYLSSARNAAMKEAAKSTAKGVFGKLL